MIRRVTRRDVANPSHYRGGKKMPLVIQASDIALDDLQPERRVDQPCQFVGEIQRVWESDDGGSTNLLIEAVEASDSSQVGCVHVEVLRHSAATAEKDRHVRRRLLRFSQAFGLLSAEQIQSSATVEPAFSAALGEKAVLSLSRRRYRDDDGRALSSLQVGFLDVWALDDPTGPDRSEWTTSGRDDVEV